MARKVKRRDFGQAKRNYLEALVAGDNDSAAQVVTRLITTKATLAEIYTEVLAPAMVAIGDLWCEARINVAQEHLATQITLAQMERLRLMQTVARPLPYAIMVACVEGESHFLGARMASDLLQSEGWSVDFLGPDVPCRALIEMVTARRVDLLCVSVTMEAHLDALRIMLKGVTTIPDRPKLIVGGAAARSGELWQSDFAGLEIAQSIDEGVKLARKFFKPGRPLVVLSDYLKELGRRIRALRLQAGWTQEQLAAATKLTRAYLVSVEGGKQNISMDVVVRVANALHVSPEQLLGRDDYVGK